MSKLLIGNYKFFKVDRANHVLVIISEQAIKLGPLKFVIENIFTRGRKTVKAIKMGMEQNLPVLKTGFIVHLCHCHFIGLINWILACQQIFNNTVATMTT